MKTEMVDVVRLTQERSREGKKTSEQRSQTTEHG